MSMWVKVRNVITNSIKKLIVSKSVIEAGEMANNIADAVNVETNVAVSNNSTDVDAILANVLKVYNDKNSVDIPASSIPMIKDMISYAVAVCGARTSANDTDVARYKALISDTKRKIVLDYKNIGLEFGKNLVLYLIEKFIMKGKIR